MSHRPAARPDHPAQAGRRAWLPALALLASAVWLVDFPVARLPLGLGLLAAAALVAWRPAWLLTLAAAALPVLDLAPWSGRWLWDEFDMLLLLACSVAWARLPPLKRSPDHGPQDRGLSAGHAGLALAFGLVLMALTVATARTLWPWPVWDANATSNPMSPFNGLRIAKGALWAAVLWWLARRMARRGLDPAGAFGHGMVLGMAGTVFVVLAERLAFSYLLDFASDYRIAGPIAAMSLGGAYIECFIAAATPFLLVRLLPPAPLWRMASGAALLAGASYALMVTFSRGGYAAMALGVVVVLAAMLITPTRRWRRVIAGVALAALAAAVAWPILTGTFAQRRLETVSADIGIRERHWAQGLRVMDNDATAVLLGMGLGRVPELFFWRSAEGEQAGGHRLVTEPDGQVLLRLGTGYAYFIDQIVPVQHGASYRLRWRVRSKEPAPERALMIGLCQKWIIASFDCSNMHAPVQAQRDTDGWITVTRQINAPGAGPGRLPRPVRLTLHVEGKLPVDVSQLSLTGEDGHELLRNGDFRAGMDHWTWTSDHHLAWHTKSLPLGVYVEQGALGLSATLLLLLLGALTAARAARDGRPEGAALLAALCAFTTVGLIDTLLDVPRFLLLWLLLCLLPGVLRPAASETATRPTAP